MQERGLDREAERTVFRCAEARFRRDVTSGDIDSLLPTVSHMLSQSSHSVGFAVPAAADAAVFERVEFVPLSRQRVLVVLVARGGHVVQKAIDIEETLDPRVVLGPHKEFCAHRRLS